jgi:hypothetical protein
VFGVTATPYLINMHDAKRRYQTGGDDKSRTDVSGPE